jgi:D-arabinitol dehydrogenase (NADP+)
VKTDGIITLRFSLDDYGRALHALSTVPAVHKVVIAP